MGKMTNAEHAAKFGERLSAIMYDKKITQSQLAKTMKVPAGTVYNWMHGLRMPRAAAMDEICRVLMCTRADLMDDPDGSSPTTELTAEMAREVFGPQEPADAASDDDLDLVLAALDAAGYGHLRALVKAAAGADQKSIDFVTAILKRNKK